MPLLLIFFITPIVEMYLLITVAGYIDAWPTIALVMLTAVIGVALLKRQGLATLTRGVSRMNAGEVPAQEMAEGILLAVAGALLLTPGFVTDAVGFVLLFPPSRQALVVLLLKRVEIHTTAPGAHGTQDAPAKSRPVIIEGDYEKK
ncbi:MAG: FxsA family protein [Pseudomonadaceae bacterium]|nr:FxsA family protein [Pseudomonadaceae bacterium]